MPLDLDIPKINNELGGLRNASYASLRLISAALVEFEKAYEEDKESLLVRYGTELEEIVKHFTKGEGQ